MKAKIENYRNGIFYYRLPGLFFSEQQLEIEVEEGRQHQGSFTVGNEEGRLMEGVLFCDGRELELLTKKVSGDSAEIPFVVHGEYLECGEERSGTVVFSGDLGECSLPYRICATARRMETPVGRISGLDSFVGLARAHWREAVRLFVSPEFPAVFLQGQPEEQAVYECLKGGSSGEQAMDEFLVWQRKKEPVTLAVEDGVEEYHLGNKPLRDHITIRREGWGYVDAEVEADAGFLELEKSHLGWEDFPGGVCELYFVMDPGRARGEREEAAICIRTPGQELAVPVVAFFAGGRRAERRQAVQRRACFVRFMENELRRRMGKLDDMAYAEEGRAVLYRLELSGQTGLTRVIGAWFDQAGGRGKETLEAVAGLYGRRDEIEPPGKVLLLFLRYQLDPAESRRKEALQAVMEGAAAYPAEYLYLDLYFKLTDERHSRPADAWRLLRQAYADGCRSPFLYLEGWRLLLEEPGVLSQLADFEIQLFNWGRKQGLYEEALAERYIYLAENEKRGQRLIFDYLAWCYGHGEKRTALNAICTLLLRGIYHSRDAFSWYRRGIRQGLKLTGLYEAYMNTLDPERFAEEGEEQLEPQVYTYFGFGSDLPDRKRAVLYQSVLSIREERPQAYQKYLPQMQEFALRQLAAGEIEERLAVLYEALLVDQEFRTRALPLLPRVMFRYLIRSGQPEITGAYVCHAELEAAAYTPLSRGAGSVELFTESARVVLEDVRGRRYVVSKPYECRRLVREGIQGKECLAAGSRAMGLLLSLSGQDGGSADSWMELVKLPGLRPEFRNRLVIGLLRREPAAEWDPEECLDYLNWEKASGAERLLAMEQILSENILWRADSALARFGCGKVDLGLLRRYVEQRILTPEERVLRPQLLEAAWRMFGEGKADGLITEYLAHYGEGSTDRLYTLWKEARRQGLSGTGIEEHLLEQMLYTECLDGMEELYFALRAGGHEEERRALVEAFLMYEAYRSVILGSQIGEGVLPDIRRQAFREGTGLCHAATLQALSGQEQLSAEDAEYAQAQIDRMAEEGHVLPFFRRFQGKCLVPEMIRHKACAIWAADPEAEIQVCFRLSGWGGDGDGPGEYHVEPMEHRFMGLFVWEILLFSGEKVEYSILEGGKQKGSFVLDAAEVEVAQEMQATLAQEADSYRILNEAGNACRAGDYQNAAERAEEYLKREYAVRHLFGPL